MKETTAKCPVCHTANFHSESYSEYGWGIVEKHEYCQRCGYTVEMSYSPEFVDFEPSITKGYRFDGQYHTKNCRKRKRMKAKYQIKYGNNRTVFRYM